jgi:hypothetical protein
MKYIFHISTNILKNAMKWHSYAIMEGLLLSWFPVYTISSVNNHIIIQYTVTVNYYILYTKTY